MTTATPSKLFLEALGLEPGTQLNHNTGVFLQCLKEFCRRFDLYWCVEAGSDCQYSVFISSDEWTLLVENDVLIEAIIVAVSASWSNYYHVRQAKVISLNEWRDRKGQ